MSKSILSLLARFSHGPRRRGRDLVLPLTRGMAARLFYFQRMFERIRGIPGAIVECGVGKGKTFQLISILAALEGKERTVWGFDSFAGYPDPSPEDESYRRRRKGEWNFITVEAMREVFGEIGLSDFARERVKIVPGFFEATLPQAPIGSIALLHLDVNLYRSYQFCLETLFPKVAPGGVVLFDEYENKDEAQKTPGAKKAIDEFFRGTPYNLERDPYFDRYFLVKR